MRSASEMRYKKMEANLGDLLNPASLLETVLRTVKEKFQWPKPKDDVQVVRVHIGILIPILLILAAAAYFLIQWSLESPT